MRILSRKTIKVFWAKHGDAEQPLKAWFREVKKAGWENQNQIKALYANASILRNSRVVFNIAGNKYRLIVRINFAYKIVYIRFIGTHEEYDKIDAEKE